jgi:AcrR family transcriptional regulator
VRLRVGDCTPAGARDGLTDSRCRDRRCALHEAVRTGGVDPGGRPVPDRAVEAGARLVSERGPATVTLEAVAEAAGRCVHGRYSIFGTRDELLAASYEWYSPLDDLVRLSRDSADFEQTVASLYRTMAVCLTRGPRVATSGPRLENQVERCLRRAPEPREPSIVDHHFPQPPLPGLRAQRRSMPRQRHRNTNQR